tara:strand:- start:4 stop:201 length:198 start_codon:yes stop_codon:yes gene_type:complete
MNKVAFLYSQNQRLDSIERVIAPPKLNMIIIDQNKPEEDWPIVDKLTKWDLLLTIEKPTEANRPL